ncbi:MAG: hypothetical protein ACRDHL_11575 [Candidatus Promineifilaceae bacterium]
MSLFGTLVTVLIGPAVPLPAPPPLLEAIESIDVQHSDQGQSGLQLSLKVGRTQLDVLDYFLLMTPLLRPMARVIILVTFNALPEVLFDGIITRQSLAPSERPGETRLTITAEDVSVMLDLEEKSAEHPAQDETVIALKIIASYAFYGLIPTVIPPAFLDPPLPTDRIPVQQGTDLAYLREMAGRHGYVFYVTPGPAPGINQAYWGPPPRLGVPQKAISANLGSESNVASINFSYDGLASATVQGVVQERTANIPIPVVTFASTRVPLVSQPAWLVQQPKRVMAYRESGVTAAQAYGRAQAMTDQAQDNVITASGQLDALRYEALLRPRGLVGVRGVGYSYDGLYYVKSVGHTIGIGSYQQSFSLTREGLGAITPVVRP